MAFDMSIDQVHSHPCRKLIMSCPSLYGLEMVEAFELERYMGTCPVNPADLYQAV